MATIPEALALALEHHQAGRLAQAEDLYRRILQAAPNQADAWNLLGVAADQRGDRAAAVECLRQAISLDGGKAHYHNNLGEIYRHAGQPAEAALCYQRALVLQPGYTQALINLGAARRALGEPNEAISCFRQVLQVQPDSLGALDALGTLLKEQGDLDGAADCYRRAVSLSGSAAARNNLANVLHAQGRPAEAVAFLRQALVLEPGLADLHNNLGTALKEQGDLAAAIASYRRAIELAPGDARVHNNLGLALHDQGDPEAAIPHLRRALALDPNYADAHFNLGNAGRDLGDLAGAIASFERTLALEPGRIQARWNRALVDLLAGDLVHGWPGYECRLRMPDCALAPLPQPRWDGSPLGGKTVLVRAEQGLGDAIQFIRYAPLIQERGGRVVLVCRPPLVRLLASSPGVDRVVAESEALPPFDVHIPLVSLPGLFGTTLKTIPGQVPYLTAPPDLVEHWRAELAGTPGMRVGIAWQGTPQHANDRNRSAPLAAFAPLAAVPGVRLFSLQKGAGREQLDALGERLSITDLGSRTGPDLAEAAAVMMNLDLVITVDTAVAHLAGALGVPVWVALPFLPDWRWLLDREDSPWYPTMRLFRQERRRDWAGVFARVAAALGSARPQAGHGASVALALQYHQAGELVRAAEVYRQLLEADPGNVEARHLGGVLACQQGDHATGIPAIEAARAARPGSAVIHHNLAKAYEAVGRLDDAAAHFRAAVRLQPDYADAHWNGALLDLLRGDFVRGWAGYEWRLRMPDCGLVPLPQPRWDGAALHGKTILLRTEQGLGDAIQFIRYAPLVRERGGRVVLACAPVLASLLATCPAVDVVVADDRPPPFDAHVPLLSLPGLLGTTIETIPARVPYLAAPPDLRERWRRELASVAGRRVGILWQGNPRHTNDHNRSVPLAAFAPMAEVPGVRLVSLQKGAGREQLDALGDRFSISDVGGRTGPDLAEAAAVMLNLDLVITVDTSLAHLAGAVGVPTWVLLPYAPDWRWLLERDDSPWYPTIRLFRQERAGDWDAVFARVVQALKEK